MSTHRRVAPLVLTVALALAPAAAQAGGSHRHPQPDPGLGAALDQILADPLAAQDSIGLTVKDAQTGERLYAHQDRVSLIPASNSKLRTSAAAMDLLGPDYRFHTDVLASGRVVNGTLTGGLTIKGYGDPTLRESDMDSLAAQLKSAGIRAVNGSLRVDATFFDDVRYHPDWSPDYETDYYAGQVSALTMSADADLDNGTFILRYTPGANPGDPVAITTSPEVAGRYLDIDNRLTTTAAGGENTVSIVREHGTNHVVLTGSVPADDGTSTEWITVEDPGLYSAAVFRAALGRAGITVSGPTVKTPAPRAARVVASDDSVPLSQILVPWMKLSNNPISEAVTKTIAAQSYRNHPGSWERGTRAIRQWMQHEHLPMQGVEVSDGSGLARTNRLTADATTALLLDVQRKPWFSTWYDSLPVAGNTTRLVGGTLRNRMKDTAATNNLHGKTGTLSGVTALSGYVTGADGRPYVFSMLTNYPADGANPRPLEDRVGTTLAAWSRPGGWTPQKGHRPKRSLLRAG